MAAFDVVDRVRSLFTENLNLKLLSFAFALVLYSLVHDAQDAQRVIDVGVIVRVPPDSANRTLVSQSATKVRLTLRGSRAALDDLHVDDLGTVQVDAHEGTEKEHRARAADGPHAAGGPRRADSSRRCSTCSGRTRSSATCRLR